MFSFISYNSSSLHFITSKNLDLKPYDLRASFVLIPTSPSPLDNLSNYSSWRNKKVLIPPFRSWPYVSTFSSQFNCILQEYSDTGPAPTLQDRAIDSFGVSIALVQFYGVQSRCGLTTSSAPNASERAHEDDNGNEDSEDLDQTDTDSSNEMSNSIGRPVLESHPYIVSQCVASSDYRLIFISYTSCI